MRSYKQLPGVRIERINAQLAPLMQELQAIVDDDNRRHMMDADLDGQLKDAIEELTGLYQDLQQHLDVDPTPQYLWDHSGGEPALSSTERLEQTGSEHLAAHR